MNKPNVKTFYSYDLAENHKVIKGLTLVYIMSIIVAIGGLIGLLINMHKGNSLAGVAYILVTVIGIMFFIPAKGASDFMNKLVSSDPIVVENWGMEVCDDGIKSRIKWEDISSFKQGSKNFFLFKQTSYIIKHSTGQFVFYSAIENIKFLENVINKNLKERNDTMKSLNWSTK